jgi:hypothetical protein
MTRKRYFLLASLAIAASSMAYGQSPAQGQLPQPDASIAATVRVAAVRFAVSHGLELPSGDLVVAHENVFKAAHPSAPQLSLETLQSQAAAMATAVGRGAKTGSAEQLLVCKFSSCAPATKASVLLVDHPRNEHVDRPLTVFIRLYSPGVPGEYDALVSVCTVEVEQRDGVWTATGFKFEPATGKLRLPK